MRSPIKDNLVKRLDDYFLKLLEEANPVIRDGEVPPADAGPKIGFVDKLKLFDAGVKWVATKNKVDPADDDDEFARARRAYSGSGKRGGSASAGGANGH